MTFRPGAGRRGDVAAGLTGAMLSLPTAVGYGLILAGPLGSEQAGIGVALLTTVVAGGVLALCGRSGVLSIGGSSGVCLLLATMLAGSPDVGAGLAMIAVCTVLASLLLGAAALSGLGGIFSRVPYPVLSGIMNGTALLMITSMQRYVLSAPEGGPAGLAWGQIAVAATVVLLVLFVRLPRRLSAVPIVLAALVAATLLHHAIGALLGPGTAGPVLRRLPSPATLVHSWQLGAAAVARLDWGGALAQALPAAAPIAFLALIETTATASVLHDQTGTPAAPRAGLAATAAGGLLSGLCGGTVATGSVGTTMMTVQAGGSTALTPLLRSVGLLAAMTLLSLAPVDIPMAAIAGVVIAGGVKLLDLDGIRLIGRAVRRGGKHRAELLGSAAVIVAVAGIAVRFSLVVAVSTGIALSLGVFVLSMANSVVRRSYAPLPGRSRTNRTEAETTALLDQAGAVIVVEVEGTLFFGSVEHVDKHVAAAVRAGARFVVLDMRRVSRLDLSGARKLLQTSRQFVAQGVELSLAYVRPGWPVWDYLDQLGVLARFDARRVHPSLDTALLAAENTLLSRLPPAALVEAPATLAFRQAGLGSDAAAALTRVARPMSLAPGAHVIRLGDEASSLYLLVSGQLDVTLPVAPAEGRSVATRLATVGAGTLFGEMALFSGAARSADVVARTEASCVEITGETVERLKRDQPGVAFELLTALARQMERNLRLANMTILALEE